ncbi:hypothetical protein [Paenibacillus lautus]|nr:hypothetical protein [Paenibacillus lautus]
MHAQRYGGTDIPAKRLGLFRLIGAGLGRLPGMRSLWSFVQIGGR